MSLHYRDCGFVKFDVALQSGHVGGTKQGSTAALRSGPVFGAARGATAAAHAV